MGTLLLADLIQRAFAIRVHYTDFGVLPLSAPIEHFSIPSIYLLAHDVGGVSLLFIISAISALALLAGYRTKIATVLSWYLLISLQQRNPLINNSGDALLRLVMFWAIFLPLGATWSLDSRKSSVEKTNPVFSMASIALFFQIFSVYLFSGLMKKGPAWHESAFALHSVLSLEQYSTGFGKFLLNFPNLLKFLSPLVAPSEIFLPFLLFVPLKKIRLFAVLILMGLHIGFASILDLELFPWVDLVALVALFPSDKIFNSSSISFSLPRASIFIWGGEIFIGLCLTSAMLWNIGLARPSFALSPISFQWTKFFRLDQNWGMFAPEPPIGFGWYLAPGILKNGQSVDALNRAENLKGDKPEPLPEELRDERWRKFYEKLPEAQNLKFAPYFGSFICRRYNDHRIVDEALISFDLTYVVEVIETKAHRNFPMGHYNCF